MGAQCSNWGMESSQSSQTSPEVRPGVAGSPVWFSQPYNERKTKAGILSLGISDVVQGSQWHGEASALGGGDGRSPCCFCQPLRTAFCLKPFKKDSQQLTHRDLRRDWTRPRGKTSTAWRRYQGVRTWSSQRAWSSFCCADFLNYLRKLSGFGAAKTCSLTSLKCTHKLKQTLNVSSTAEPKK